MANDMTILGGIIILFVAVGGLLPFINDAFGQSSSSIDVDSFNENFTSSARGLDDEAIEPTWLNPTGSLNAMTVLASILKMFFWTFGDLPYFVDLLIFVPIRILFVLIVARNIWIGGGG